MTDQNIRLQKDEFRPFANDESLVELADGSGYYGTLAVFHALHCEKRLHHYLYRDSYYPDLDDDGDIRLLYHTGKFFLRRGIRKSCQRLKQSIVWTGWGSTCNVTPTRHWSHSTGEPSKISRITVDEDFAEVNKRQPHPLAMDRAQHQCVSWEPLEQWMAQHSFDAFEPGLLMHPVYGEYGPGFGNLDLLH